MNSDRLSREEILCLYSLVSTANEGLILDEYHFGDYAEQKVCINKEDDLWQVYCCERGHKFDINTFDDCKKVCMWVIWLCSYNKEDIEPATAYFLMTLQNSFKLSDEEINKFINKYEFSIEKKESRKKLVKEIN